MANENIGLGQTVNWNRNPYLYDQYFLSIVIKKDNLTNLLKENEQRCINP